MSTFTTTATAHTDCAACRTLFDQAAGLARVTGSTGATHTDRAADGTAHSVTVIARRPAPLRAQGGHTQDQADVTANRLALEFAGADRRLQVCSEGPEGVTTYLELGEHRLVLGGAIGGGFAWTYYEAQEHGEGPEWVETGRDSCQWPPALRSLLAEWVRDARAAADAAG